MQPDQTNLFDSIADDFATRLRNHETPDIEAYAQRYPELAERIRRLFPVMQRMEKRPAASEGDFDDSGELERELGDLQQAPAQRQLGDFRIVREIGRGGMGIVYQAEQESLGRFVALKILPNSAQFDQRKIERFQHEARASGMLHHANIVPTFGVGREEDISFIVMQYIEGTSLDRVIKELSSEPLEADPLVPDHSLQDTNRAIDTHPSITGGELEPPLVNEVEKPVSIADEASEPARPRSSSEEANKGSPAAFSGSQSNISSLSTGGRYFRNIAKIGLQVSDALQYAHSRNILHRDIKPANLLLDNEGHVWVTDFGLAKLQNQADLTETGETVGTLRYLPPEQLNGDSDARSDVYSLGLTLYELLTLKPAFDGKDFGQLLQSVTDSNPTAPRKLAPRIPRDLETIVMKAIAKSPDKRYQTAAALRDDLDLFLDGKPIRAKQSSQLDRFVKTIRRRPVVSALAGLLIASIVVGGTLVTWKWREATNLLALAEQESASRKAINDFLIKDLLNFASPNVEPDPDVSLRKVLDQAAASVNGRFKDQPLIEAELRMAIGKIYLDLGRFSDSMAQFETAYRIRGENLGLEHPDSMRALQMLGNLEHKIGNSHDALKILQQTLDFNIENYGEFSFEVAESKQGIGSIAQLLGDFELAERYLDDYDEIAAKIPELDQLIAKRDRVALLRSKGEFQQAKALCESMEADLIKQLNIEAGPLELNQTNIEAFRALTDVRDQLGILANDEGFPERAAEIHAQTLADSRKLLGDKHELTLGTLGNLAGSLLKSGQFEEAKELLLEGMETSESELGRSHLTTMLLFNSYVLALVGEENYDRAIELATENYELAADKFGQSHPDTITFTYNLGVAYFRNRDYENAERWIAQTATNAKKTLGVFHPQTACALADLGNAHLQLGKIEVAEEELLEAIECSRKSLRKNHPDLLTTITGLSKIYMLTKRYELAEPLCRECVEGYEAELGNEAWQTAIAKNFLAVALKQQKKYDESHPYFAELFELRAGQGELLSKRNLSVLRLLVDVEHKTKRYEETVKRLRKLCRAYELSSDAEITPLDYLQMLGYLGRAEMESGDLPAAKKSLLSAYEGLLDEFYVTPDEFEDLQGVERKELQTATNRLMELFKRLDDQEQRKTYRTLYRILKAPSSED